MAAKKAAKKVTSTALTTNTQVSVAAPKGYKVRRQVILPAFLLRIGEPKIFIVTGAMEKSTYVDPDPKKKGDKPMTLLPVGDVETGEHMRLIVPSVIEGNLTENYPDNEYIGKVFSMEKLAKRPGKRYHDVRLFELEKDDSQ